MVEIPILMGLRQVEIFKTNVQDAPEAKTTLLKLSEYFPLYGINFDLEDCDRILRVEGENISPEQIVAVMMELNLNCEILEN